MTRLSDGLIKDRCRRNPLWISPLVAAFLAFALLPHMVSAHIIPTGGVKVDCNAGTVTVSVTAWAGKVEIKNLGTSALALKPVPGGASSGDVVFTTAEIGGNGSYVAEREATLDPTHVDPVPVPFTVDCTPPPPPHGTLAANILVCSSGSPTATPGPGSFTYTGPSSGSGNSPMSQSVLASPPDYAVTATAGSGFTLAMCGSGIGTASVKSVAVPSNGTGSLTFYESLNPGTLEARIFLCSNGSPTATPEPGSFTFTGPGSGSGASPLSQSVPASPPNYVVTATAGTGFTLVTCGSAIGTATVKSAGVPSNGTGSVTFYETRDTGNLAANIFLCDAGTQTATHPATSGSLQIDGGLVTAANMLPSSAVPTGSHTVNATAPADYHLVTCGSYNGASSLPVTVTNGGTSVVNFYVVRDLGNLAAHIYLCVNSAESTTNPTSKGSLGATNEPTVADNNMSLTGIPTGPYTVSATAPADYHLVTCGNYNGASTLDRTVATSPAPAAVANFYVVRNTGSLSGNIIDCSSGTPTTEVNGGNLSAAGPTNVASANPLSATVNTGSYTVTATAPNDFHLVACNGVSDSSTQSTTVTSTTPGSVTFYVAKNASGTQAAGTGGNLGLGLPRSGAALVQPNTGLGDVLRAAQLGLILVVLGALAMMATRRRREA